METLPSLVIFFISILLQALFAGYETGFVSTNAIRLRHVVESKSSWRARKLLYHISHPGTMLTTLLLGTNLAVISGTIALTLQMNKFNLPREMQEALSALVIAPIFLVFSEIIPKTIFRFHAHQLTLAFFPVIHVFYLLLYPVAVPIARITGVLFRAVGGEERNMSAVMTSLEDVRVLVDEGAEQGTIERDEQKMIHSVIDLHDTQAKAIMTPRIDIQALPDTATREELLALFEQSGRTRIPIYHETIDRIIGIIEAHDVLLDDQPDNPDIKRFVRDVMHVPDSIKLIDLLERMKREKRHVAIVTDEYGGTDGLVTLEDILEEIFGEIHDEHDAEEKPIQQVGPQAYVVEGRTPLGLVEETLGIKIENVQVETIGGWVSQVAGRIPAEGEVVVAGSLRITVLDGTPTRVNKIRLELLESQEQTKDVLSKK